MIKTAKPPTASSETAKPGTRTDRPRVSDDDIGRTIVELTTLRGPEKTICPSEVARALGGDKQEGWSPLMPAVRRVARRLMGEGAVVIVRKGHVVDPDDFRGIYRLRAPRNGDA